MTNSGDASVVSSVWMCTFIKCTSSVPDPCCLRAHGRVRIVCVVLVVIVECSVLCVFKNINGLIYGYNRGKRICKCRSWESRHKAKFIHQKEGHHGCEGRSHVLHHVSGGPFRECACVLVVPLARHFASVRARVFDVRLELPAEVFDAFIPCRWSPHIGRRRRAGEIKSKGSRQVSLFTRARARRGVGHRQGRGKHGHGHERRALRTFGTHDVLELARDALEARRPLGPVARAHLHRLRATWG